ncbi:MAG: lipolytic enzyme family [Chthonomonadaceae bacterium]|nr:lipolytic enzyme family [Chthonomonadaceae bacterium]
MGERKRFMQWYEEEVRGLEQAREKSPPFCDPVAFYGSSSIRLWNTLAQDFAGERVVNLGFGGSTLEACASFFERLVVPYSPRALVLYAGDNDIGDGKSPEAIEGYYQILSDKVRRYLGPIPFAFLSIKSSPARHHLIDSIVRTNALIRQEHLSRPGRIYVDVFSLMLNIDGTPRAELYSEDGLHLNAAGYAVWRRALCAHHDELFGTELHAGKLEQHAPRVPQVV